ncbi:MAG: hypothetical protein ACPKQO_00620 [Nitrososphaeraceae archaeon]
MMKQISIMLPILVAIVISIGVVGNINNNVYAQNGSNESSKTSMNNTLLTYDYKDPIKFVHGIEVDIDGVKYYFDGPADAYNGSKDAPGHYWWQDTPTHLYGLHFNIGPFGEEKWWSSDAKENEILFFVDAIIAPWTENDSIKFSQKGYTHYHELLRVDNGEKHPELVVWFKHVGIPNIFSFDKGPMPEEGHIVTPGVDHEFLTNYYIPYKPQQQEDTY